jgi:hypothetical protein
LAADDKPAIVAVTADQHVNSTLGLCPPAVTLDDGGTYRGSRAQRAIWAAWKEYWTFVGELKEKLGATVYGVYAGDLNDKNVYAHGELISGADADVTKMTVRALQPALAVTDRDFFLRGTEAHVGKKANLEEEVAADIETAEPDPQTGTFTWYWLRASFGGVSFDVAHHPETFARRPWTEDAAAARCSAIIRDRYAERREEPPDVAIRAHVHKFIPGGRRLPPQVFYCPAWQVPTAFAYRVGGGMGERAVGGLVFICEGGEYRFPDGKTPAVLWKPRGLRRRPWKES